MTMVAIIAIVVASAEVAAATIVYAQNQSKNQNTTTTQQKLQQPTTIAISPIKRLNASIIINAINSKIRSVYDGGGEMPVISKVRH